MIASFGQTVNNNLVKSSMRDHVVHLYIAVSAPLPQLLRGEVSLNLPKVVYLAIVSLMGIVSQGFTAADSHSYWISSR